MSSKFLIVAAKLLAMVGFLVLVVSTYYIRSEVLELSHKMFFADTIRAENELKQLRESYPERVKQHEAELKNYEMKTEYYRRMLDLYQNNYDEYVKQVKDDDKLPLVPDLPQKPTSPEVAEKLYEINSDFRNRKNQYFETASWLNWLACTAALMLVGSLVYLLMFDDNGQRWHYLAALGISFIFLIGPAFQSILTGIIGILQAPGIS